MRDIEREPALLTPDQAAVERLINLQTEVFQRATQHPVHVPLSDMIDATYARMKEVETSIDEPDNAIRQIESHLANIDD